MTSFGYMSSTTVSKSKWVGIEELLANFIHQVCTQKFSWLQFKSFSSYFTLMCFCNSEPNQDWMAQSYKKGALKQGPWTCNMFKAFSLTASNLPACTMFIDICTECHSAYYTTELCDNNY